MTAAERFAHWIFRPLVLGVVVSVLLTLSDGHGHNIHPNLYRYTLIATAALFALWAWAGIAAALADRGGRQ